MMKNSKFISWPLVTENLKRFWGLAAAGFMVLFLSGPFVIFERADNLNSSTVKMVCGMSNFGYVIVSIGLPIVAAVSVFGYLHKVNSVNLMHSMPFSRLSLYVSNAVSGLLLSIVPVIMNALILLAIKRPVYDYEYINGIRQIIEGSQDYFTAGNILSCALTMIVIEIFSYAISCFAAAICGNGVIHLLTAAALNFVLPLFVLTFEGWCDKFLYGYVYSEALAKFLIKLHPLVYSLSEYLFGFRSVSGAFPAVIYVLVSAVIFVLGYIVYARRPLEKCGDSYVFEIAHYVIGFLLTYLPAAAAVFVFDYELGTIPALAVGGFMGFVIGSMILDKSFRIFNLEHLKLLGLYVLGIALIMSIFAFDLTGFEKRIPDTRNISSAELSVNNLYERYSTDVIYHEAENLEHVAALHRHCLDGRSYQSLETPYEDYSNLYITYTYSSGTTMERRYSVPVSLLNSDKHIKALYESEESDAVYDELCIFDPEKSNVEVRGCLYDMVYERENSVLNFNAGFEPAARQRIIDALLKDLRDRSFESACAGRVNFGTVNISCYYEVDHHFTSDELREMGISDYSLIDLSYDYDNHGDVCGYTLYADISFNADFKNLIAVLEGYGCMDYILPNAEGCFMILSRETGDPFGSDQFSAAQGPKAPTAATYEIYDYEDMYLNGWLPLPGGLPPESENGMAVVTDKTEMKDILMNACRSRRPNGAADSVMCYLIGYPSVEGNTATELFGEQYYCWYVDADALPSAVRAQVDKYL